MELPSHHTKVSLPFLTGHCSHVKHNQWVKDAWDLSEWFWNCLLMYSYFKIKSLKKWGKTYARKRKRKRRNTPNLETKTNKLLYSPGTHQLVSGEYIQSFQGRYKLGSENWIIKQGRGSGWWTPHEEALGRDRRRVFLDVRGSNGRSGHSRETGQETQRVQPWALGLPRPSSLRRPSQGEAAQFTVPRSPLLLWSNSVTRASGERAGWRRRGHWQSLAHLQREISYLNAALRTQDAELRPVTEFYKEGLNHSADSKGQGTGGNALNYNLDGILRRE